VNAWLINWSISWFKDVNRIKRLPMLKMLENPFEDHREHNVFHKHMGNGTRPLFTHIGHKCALYIFMDYNQ
jgi:hypothetical protein